MARDLIKILDEAKQEIPSQLRDMGGRGGYGGSSRGKALSLLLGRGGYSRGGYGGSRGGYGGGNRYAPY